MTEDRSDLDTVAGLSRQFVLESAIKTLLEHQEATRRILEDLARSVEMARESDKVIASLQVQVDTVREAVKGLREECREMQRVCSDSMSKQFDAIEQQRREHISNSKEDRDDMRGRIAQLQQRLLEVERSAAESGGRYGAMASIIGIVLVELIRWVVSHHR